VGDSVGGVGGRLVIGVGVPCSLGVIGSLGGETSRGEMSGVEMSGVEMSGTDASGVEMSGVEMPGTDTSGVEASGIDTSGAGLLGVCPSDRVSAVSNRRLLVWPLRRHFSSSPII
jgi:hypothetical protein